MPDDPTEALDGLWTDYKSNGTANARERLILHYSPLVKFVAGRVAAGLPQNIEQSDLVSYGIFGLIDAIDKFDPGRGFKFETYAISRIKGAIIDELRSIDWVPRSVRAKARAIERAISKLENELRRTPEDGEVAAELDWTEGELTQTLSQISFTGLVALDDLLAAGSADRSGSATVSDTITDGKDDGLQGNLDVRARAARRGIAVAGYEDIFLDFKTAYPSLGVSEHTCGRSEKAEQHTAGVVGRPSWRCRGGHLCHQRLRILVHRFETRAQTRNFLT